MTRIKVKRGNWEDGDRTYEFWYWWVGIILDLPLRKYFYHLLLTSSSHYCQLRWSFSQACNMSRSEADHKETYRILALYFTEDQTGHRGLVASYKKHLGLENTNLCEVLSTLLTSLFKMSFIFLKSYLWQFPLLKRDLLLNRGLCGAYILPPFD